MRRIISLNLLIGSVFLAGCAGFAGPGGEFAGKRIVPVLNEPRHRTVHHQDDVYLLDVQINAGDTSFPHTHDAAMLYTFISAGSGPQYGRISTVTDYATEEFTHEVSNDGPDMLRILALSNYGAGNPDADADRPQGLAQQPQLENPWFRSWRLTLGPGEQSELQVHANPTVVVQATQGKVHVSRADSLTAELDAMGDWAWRDANAPFRIKNMGAMPVEVVVNEARR